MNKKPYVKMAENGIFGDKIKLAKIWTKIKI